MIALDLLIWHLSLVVFSAVLFFLQALSSCLWILLASRYFEVTQVIVGFLSDLSLSGASLFRMSAISLTYWSYNQQHWLKVIQQTMYLRCHASFYQDRFCGIDGIWLVYLKGSKVVQCSACQWSLTQPRLHYTVNTTEIRWCEDVIKSVPMNMGCESHVLCQIARIQNRF